MVPHLNPQLRQYQVTIIVPHLNDSSQQYIHILTNHQRISHAKKQIVQECKTTTHYGVVQACQDIWSNIFIFHLF